MAQRDLRDFLALLDQRGQLHRISAPVDPDLELAAIADRVLALGGPALLFENVIGSSMPVLVNLLGTVERVVWSMGLERVEQLEELGAKLALLQQPRPPKGLQETAAFGRILWDLIKARPDRDLTPPCQQIVLKGEAVNLDALPLIRPWPGDAGRVITLGLVITKDPETKVPNVGVYRLQQQDARSMTVHWLSVRGGARHLRKAAAMGRSVWPTHCTRSRSCRTDQTPRRSASLSRMRRRTASANPVTDSPMDRQMVTIRTPSRGGWRRWA